MIKYGMVVILLANLAIGCNYANASTKGPYDMSCMVASYGNGINRCENSEIICYLSLRTGMFCKFK